MAKTRIIIITGPTATGKSSLAFELAGLLDGEIINADSMQVYRHMDIGTAKPSKEERAAVAHHLIDILNPDEDYTAADFRKDAARDIKDVSSTGKTVIVAGGTGLYIKALTKGLFEGPGRDKALRERLAKLAARSDGKDSLYRRLKEVDPEAAARTHPNNTVRVIRALEVYMLSRRPISELQKEHGFFDAPFDTLKIGIMKDRDTLYNDIDKRVCHMVEEGLLEETRSLLDMGYTADLKPMRGLGYKEMTGFIKGEYGFDEAVGLIKRNTRRFAKRQLTWFNKDDEIRWFSPGQKKDIIKLVKEYLR